MKTIYVLKSNNIDNINKLIRYNIHFIKIKYIENGCFLYVDEDNYLKIEKYFSIYNIEIIKVLGLKKYQFWLKRYYIFIISFIIGMLFIYLLSKIIFDIKIMTNKKELVEIIENELKENNLKKYSFIKSFEEKERIKNKILKDYQDKFEWLEIERVGSKYYVHILERVINEKKPKTFQHIVAKRNAIIKEIKASNGQIIKKVNDYVNKGDIIISGNILKNDEIKGQTMAKGEIYGETWYTVKVTLPNSYEKENIVDSKEKYSINFLNKKIFLFGKSNVKDSRYEDKIIFQSNLLPISFNKTIVYKVKKDNYFYTYDQLEDKGITVAKEKLLETLSKDSKILAQKKLKLYEENSKIIIEVFFKVYENITDYQKID